MGSRKSTGYIGTPLSTKSGLDGHSPFIWMQNSATTRQIMSFFRKMDSFPKGSITQIKTRMSDYYCLIDRELLIMRNKYRVELDASNSWRGRTDLRKT